MNDATQTPSPAASDSPGDRRVTAGEQLTIHTIEAFAADCRADMSEAAGLTIDLGTVVACDTLGIQLLLAARRSGEISGKPVRLANASGAVRQAAAAIGCESFLSP